MKIYFVLLLLLVGCNVLPVGDRVSENGRLIIEGTMVRAQKKTLLKLCTIDSLVPSPSSILVLYCRYVTKGIHTNAWVVFHQAAPFEYWRAVCAFPRVSCKALDPLIGHILLPRPDSLVVHVSHGEINETRSYVYRHQVWHPR